MVRIFLNYTSSYNDYLGWKEKKNKEKTIKNKTNKISRKNKTAIKRQKIQTKGLKKINITETLKEDNKSFNTK